MVLTVYDSLKRLSKSAHRDRVPEVRPLLVDLKQEGQIGQGVGDGGNARHVVPRVRVVPVRAGDRSRVDVGPGRENHAPHLERVGRPDTEGADGPDRAVVRSGRGGVGDETHPRGRVVGDRHARPLARPVVLNHHGVGHRVPHRRAHHVHALPDREVRLEAGDRSAVPVVRRFRVGLGLRDDLGPVHEGARALDHGLHVEGDRHPRRDGPHVPEAVRVIEARRAPVVREPVGQFVAHPDARGLLRAGVRHGHVERDDFAHVGAPGVHGFHHREIDVALGRGALLPRVPAHVPLRIERLQAVAVGHAVRDVGICVGDGGGPRGGHRVDHYRRGDRLAPEEEIAGEVGIHVRVPRQSDHAVAGGRLQVRRRGGGRVVPRRGGHLVGEVPLDAGAAHRRDPVVIGRVVLHFRIGIGDDRRSPRARRADLRGGPGLPVAIDPVGSDALSPGVRLPGQGDRLPSRRRDQAVRRRRPRPGCDENLLRKLGEAILRVVGLQPIVVLRPDRDCLVDVHRRARRDRSDLGRRILTRSAEDTVLVDIRLAVAVPGEGDEVRVRRGGEADGSGRWAFVEQGRGPTPRQAPGPPDAPMSFRSPPQEGPVGARHSSSNSAAGSPASTQGVRRDEQIGRGPHEDRIGVEIRELGVVESGLNIAVGHGRGIGDRPEHLSAGPPVGIEEEDRVPGDQPRGAHVDRFRRVVGKGAVGYRCGITGNIQTSSVRVGARTRCIADVVREYAVDDFRAPRLVKDASSIAVGILARAPAGRRLVRLNQITPDQCISKFELPFVVDFLHRRQKSCNYNYCSENNRRFPRKCRFEQSGRPLRW